MISPESELLLLSLWLDDPSAAAVKARKIIEGHHTDLEKLFDLADYHSVKPQLAQLVSKISPDLLPAGFRAMVEGAYHQNLVDQLDHVSEFFTVMNKLGDAGITIVPFKGFWLAETFYGNLADRESDDIDVFVRLPDLEKVRRLMPETGYLTGAPYLEEVNANDCEYNFGKYVNGRCVSHFEFHWRMAPSGFSLDITFDDLAPCMVPSEVQGQSLPAFSHSATLLLTVMHHGGKDAFIRLKQVYDIALILRHDSEIDWHWLSAEAKRFGCLSLVAVSAGLASLITGVEVPVALKAEAESERIRRLVQDRIRYLSVRPRERRQFRYQVRDWLFRIRSRDGVMVKAGLAWRFIRKAFIPWMIPKRVHYLFMRKYVIPDYAKEI